MRKLSVLLLGASFVVLLMGQAGSGALVTNYAWQVEYNNTNTNWYGNYTVALWNFNATSTVAGGHKSNVIGAGTNDWYATTADVQTTNQSNATFVSGGKWGGGLENIGQTATGGYQYDRATVNGGTTAANLFPTGSDPSLTVECWVKFDTTGTYPEFLVDHKSTASAETAAGYQLSLAATGELKFSLGTGLANATIATNFISATSAVLTWTAGQWYHIAGTWDGVTDTARIYRDATEVATLDFTDGTKAIVNSTKALVIGQRLTSNYGALDGVLDDVRLSSVAYDFKVPEPATILILGIGGFALRAIRRRRR